MELTLGPPPKPIPGSLIASLWLPAGFELRIMLFLASPYVSIARPVKSPLHIALLSLVVKGAITLVLFALNPT